MLVVNPIEYIAYPDSQHKQRIPVRQILAEPWHQRRLADCREKLQQNKKPPLVQAFGYELASRLWYILQDGIHRTVAAREARKRTIASICRGYSKCSPEYFRLYRSVEADRWSLLRIEEWSQQGQVWITQTCQQNLQPEIAALAYKIGIPQVSDFTGFPVAVTSDVEN